MEKWMKHFAHSYMFLIALMKLNLIKVQFLLVEILQHHQ